MFDVSEANGGVPFNSLSDALGANGANIPSEYRAGGMSIKFILQLYTVDKSTSADYPTGTELQSDPVIAVGTRYKASDLSAFAMLPTTEAVVYYISDGEATPTYTIYTITKNAVNACEYMQYRYMSTDAATNATFVNVANWQGVDETPTAGSHNFVTSGGVAPLDFELNGLNKTITKERAVGTQLIPVFISSGTKVKMQIDRSGDSYTLYYKFVNSSGTEFVNTATDANEVEVTLQDDAVNFWTYVTGSSHTSTLVVTLTSDGLKQFTEKSIEDINDTLLDVEYELSEITETNEVSRSYSITQGTALNTTGKANQLLINVKSGDKFTLQVSYPDGNQFDLYSYYLYSGSSYINGYILNNYSLEITAASNLTGVGINVSAAQAISSGTVKVSALISKSYLDTLNDVESKLQEEIAEKADEIEPSINLFNPNSTSIIHGKFINGAGKFTEGSGYFISEPIKLEVGQSITVNSMPTGVAMAGYYGTEDDSSYVGIRVIASPYTFTNSLSNKVAIYIRFSGRENNINNGTYMLNYGTSSLPYQDYCPRNVLRRNNILQSKGNSENDTISQKKLTELIEPLEDFCSNVESQGLIQTSGNSVQYEVIQGRALNTTSPNLRYKIDIPSGRKIRIKINYPEGNVVDNYYLYKSDGSTYLSLSYNKNNEWVEYTPEDDYASIGFYISATHAVADGTAQLFIEVSSVIDGIEETIESLTKDENRTRLADVLYHWLNGEKFPIGFQGDSTTDGTSTTGWKTVPNTSLDEPCSHPGTEAVWWLTQTEEGQAYYAEHIAQGESIHDICNAVHLTGKGRGKVLYNWHLAYPYLLRDLLRKELGNNNLEVYNIGYYGASLGNNYSQLDDIYSDVYSDVKMVGITLGINDRATSASPAAYYETIRSQLIMWVNYFIAKGITPFMVTNQVVTQCGVSDGQYNQIYQDYIQTICNKVKYEIAKKYNLEVIDLNDFGRLVIECSSYSYTNITENLHFKDIGHKLEAGFLFSKLIPWVNKTDNAEKLYFGFNCANSKTGLKIGALRTTTSDAFKVQVNTTQSSATDNLIFDAYMFNNSKNGAYNVKYLTPVASGYIVIDGDTSNPITIDSTEMTLEPWDIGLHHVQVYTGESTTIAFKGFELTSAVNN